MSTLMQTSTRCLVDLRRPDLSRIDIRRDIAEPLARTARFSGHMGANRSDGHIWSVAMHCVVGAKALLEETNNPLAAVAFLLHDAHESPLGDNTTPFIAALDAEVVALLGRDTRGIVTRANRQIKRRLDAAIWRLAGIDAPPAPIVALVREMDFCMLAAEARQILGASESDLRNPDAWPDGLADAKPVRTHGALTPRSTKRAADEWMALWSTWTTSLRDAASNPTDSRRHDGVRRTA